MLYLNVSNALAVDVFFQKFPQILPVIFCLHLQTLSCIFPTGERGLALNVSGEFLSQAPKHTEH